MTESHSPAPESPTEPRRATLGAKLLLSLGSVLLFLGGIEGALRLAGFARPPKFYFDDQIGLRFFPDRQVTMLFGEQTSGTASLNEWGMRGPAFAAEPSPGTCRIVCLGDSFTMGWGVSDDETYPVALQRWLDQNVPDLPCEVLNVGTVDHNTVNELRVYRHLVRDWKPDVVILGYVPNDVQPETLGATSAGTRFEHRLQSTAIYSYLKRKLRGSDQFDVGWNAENQRRRKEFTENFRTITCDPEDPISRSYWEVSMNALESLVQETRADGVEFLLVRFPGAGQVRSLETAEQEKRAGRRPRKLAGGLLAQAKLRTEAKRLGVRLINLLPEFRSLGVEGAFGPTDTSHPSPEAFTVAAERIGSTLVSLGLLRDG